MDGHARAKDVLREITTHSAEETIAFGRSLAEVLSPPKLVLLRGDLGAGKTTWSRESRRLSTQLPRKTSPVPPSRWCMSIAGPQANLYHIDLYRIDTLRELETLGLDDLRADNSILLIEWGEKFPRLLRERDVEIALEREGENSRRIRISGPCLS